MAAALLRLTAVLLLADLSAGQHESRRAFVVDIPIDPQVGSGSGSGGSGGSGAPVKLNLDTCEYTIGMRMEGIETISVIQATNTSDCCSMCTHLARCRFFSSTNNQCSLFAKAGEKINDASAVCGFIAGREELVSTTVTTATDTTTSGTDTSTSGTETSTSGTETSTSGTETSTSGTDTTTSGTETITSVTQTTTSGTETTITETTSTETTTTTTTTTTTATTSTVSTTTSTTITSTTTTTKNLAECTCDAYNNVVLRTQAGIDVAVSHGVFGPTKAVPSLHDVEIVHLSPSYGCTVPYQDIAGKVALVQRGKCSFLQKAQAAEAAGAVGLVIYNTIMDYERDHGSRPRITTQDSTPGQPSADQNRETVTIPVVMVDPPDMYEIVLDGVRGNGSVSMHCCDTHASTHFFATEVCQPTDTNCIIREQSLTGCLQSENALDCSYAGIHTIPATGNTFPSVETLDLTGNRLTKLLSTDFEATPSNSRGRRSASAIAGLKGLLLSHNSIATMQQFPAGRFPSLERLDMRSNPIIEIPAGALEHLPSLKYFLVDVGIDFSSNSLPSHMRTSCHLPWIFRPPGTAACSSTATCVKGKVVESQSVGICSSRNSDTCVAGDCVQTNADDDQGLTVAFNWQGPPNCAAAFNSGLCEDSNAFSSIVQRHCPKSCGICKCSSFADNESGLGHAQKNKGPFTCANLQEEGGCEPSSPSHPLASMYCGTTCQLCRNDVPAPKYIYTGCSCDESDCDECILEDGNANDSGYTSTCTKFATTTTQEPTTSTMSTTPTTTEETSTAPSTTIAPNGSGSGSGSGSSSGSGYVEPYTTVVPTTVITTTTASSTTVTGTTTTVDCNGNYDPLYCNKFPTEFCDIDDALGAAFRNGCPVLCGSCTTSTTSTSTTTTATETSTTTGTTTTASSTTATETSTTTDTSTTSTTTTTSSTSATTITGGDACAANTPRACLTDPGCLYDKTTKTCSGCSSAPDDNIGVLLVFNRHGPQSCADAKTHGLCLPDSPFVDIVRHHCPATCGVCKSACKSNPDDEITMVGKLGSFAKNCQGLFAEGACEPASNGFDIASLYCQSTCKICQGDVMASTMPTVGPITESPKNLDGGSTSSTTTTEAPDDVDGDVDDSGGGDLDAPTDEECSSAHYGGEASCLALAGCVYHADNDHCSGPDFVSPPFGGYEDSSGQYEDDYNTIGDDLTDPNLITLAMEVMFNLIDTDSDGGITFQEFAAMILSNADPFLYNLFPRADVDGNKVLTSLELMTLLDTSLDGIVDFGEFLSALSVATPAPSPTPTVASDESSTTTTEEPAVVTEEPGDLDGSETKTSTPKYRLTVTSTTTITTTVTTGTTTTTTGTTNGGKCNGLGDPHTCPRHASVCTNEIVGAAVKKICPILCGSCPPIDITTTVPAPTITTGTTLPVSREDPTDLDGNGTTTTTDAPLETTTTTEEPEVITEKPGDLDGDSTATSTSATTRPDTATTATDTTKTITTVTTTTYAPYDRLNGTQETCFDYPMFTDSRGFSCSDWAALACRSAPSLGYSRYEMAQILEHCPLSCNECTPETSAPSVCTAADDSNFRDVLWQGCSTWAGSNCAAKAANSKFTTRQTQTLLEQCPFACGLCECAEGNNCRATADSNQDDEVERDPCESIQCGALCAREPGCGWSSDDDMCVTGAVTDEYEEAEAGECQPRNGECKWFVMWETGKSCSCSTSGCTTCEFTDFQEQCTQCGAGAYLENGKCVSECSIGRVPMGDTDSTRACAEPYTCNVDHIEGSSGSPCKCEANNCNSCDVDGSGSQCTQCGAGYKLFQNQCVHDCPVDTDLISTEYGRKGGSQMCWPRDYCKRGDLLGGGIACECPAGCLECRGSMCRSCKVGWQLLDGFCVSECPAPFRSSVDGTRECLPPHVLA